MKQLIFILGLGLVISQSASAKRFQCNAWTSKSGSFSDYKEGIQKTCEFVESEAAKCATREAAAEGKFSCKKIFASSYNQHADEYTNENGNIEYWPTCEVIVYVDCK